MAMAEMFSCQKSSPKVLLDGCQLTPGGPTAHSGGTPPAAVETTHSHRWRAQPNSQPGHVERTARRARERLTAMRPFLTPVLRAWSAGEELRPTFAKRATARIRAG